MKMEMLLCESKKIDRNAVRKIDTVNPREVGTDCE